MLLNSDLTIPLYHRRIKLKTQMLTETETEIEMKPEKFRSIAMISETTKQRTNSKKSKTLSKTKRATKPKPKSKPKMSHNNRRQYSQPRGSALLLRLASFCILACVLSVVPSFSKADVYEAYHNFTAPIDYSNYNDSVSYFSNADFEPGGMAPFYYVTDKIMESFSPDEPLPPGYVIIRDDNTLAYGPKTEENEWGTLLKQYWPALALALTCLILIMLIPIIGLCFCFCRYAGACGANSDTCDSRNDACKRFLYGLLLLLLLIGLLFGVITAFISIITMRAGTRDLSLAMSNCTMDAHTFLDVAIDQTNYVFITNYDELQTQMIENLDNIPSFLIGRLENVSNSVSLFYLTDFLTKLPEVRALLVQFHGVQSDLPAYTSQLGDALRDVKRKLLVLLDNCTDPECKKVLEDYNIGMLDVGHLKYKPVATKDIIDALTEFIGENMPIYSYVGRSNFSTFCTELKSELVKNNPEIIVSLTEMGDGLRQVADNITNKVAQIAHQFTHTSKNVTSTVDTFVDDYSPSQFYLALIACVLLVIILVLLICALLCGICGKRPDQYGERSCTKGTGARLLLITVYIIFFAFSIILLIALIHFLLGLVAYRGFCRPMEDPEHDELARMFNEYVDLHKALYSTRADSSDSTLPPFTLSGAIVQCKNDQTIYEVLRLHNAINVSAIMDFKQRHEIEWKLQRIGRGLNSSELDSIILMSPQDKERLLKFANDPAMQPFDDPSQMDMEPCVISEVLKLDFSLTELARKLKALANKLTGENAKDIRSGLRIEALHLDTYHQNLIKPIESQCNETKHLGGAITKSLKFRELSFNESIHVLVDEVWQAQKYLRKSGVKFLTHTMNDVGKDMRIQIENFMRRAVYMLENDIGRCGPVYTAFNGSLVAVCRRIVDPLNTFWVSLLWCLLLFLPILCLAIKLISLYRKRDCYAQPESDYLYDAYSERDHIPMSNGKNKRRKHKDYRRRGEYYEDTAGPAPHGTHGTHGGPHAHTAAAMRDTRYNDMAPKHWDGGPPRYQNPPMAPPASEYERPPPYYYPGATEQD